MLIIKKVTKKEIEDYLFSLGERNIKDNLNQLHNVKNHYHVTLSEKDFKALVFVKNSSTSSLTANGRTLLRVSEYVRKHLPELSSTNWDLNKVLERTADLLKTANNYNFKVLLRRSRGSEKMHGEWYIQDGNHRALGYQTAILNGLTSFNTQEAYIVTDEELNTLLPRKSLHTSLPCDQG
jgi:hypothetical protein